MKWSLLLTLVGLGASVSAQDTLWNEHPAISFISSNSEDITSLGIHYTLRTNEAVNATAAIGLAYFRLRSDEGNHEGIALQNRQLFISRPLELAHFRFQSFASLNYFRNKNRKNELFTEMSFMAGLGITLWRFEASADFGPAFSSYGISPSTSLSLTYCFNRNARLLNPVLANRKTGKVQRRADISTHLIQTFDGERRPLTGYNLSVFLRKKQPFSFVPGLGISSYRHVYPNHNHLTGETKGNSIEGYGFLEYQAKKLMFSRIGLVAGIEKLEFSQINGYQFNAVVGLLSGFGVQYRSFHISLDVGGMVYANEEHAVIRLGAGYQLK